MALIIRLNNEVPASQDELDSNDMEHRHSAEVILFPGVRYERWADAQPTKAEQQLSGERLARPDRDWLDI